MFLLTVSIDNMILISIYYVYQLIFRKLQNMPTSIFSQGTLSSFVNLMSCVKNYLVIKYYSKYEFIYFNIKNK